MLSGELRVHQVDVTRDCEWHFRDSAPHWSTKEHGSLGVFDPFPAYPHALADVERAAAHVADCCPPLWDVDLYVADREELGRSNGFSSLHEGGQYIGDEWVKTAPVGLILMSGKRVPPHPATTRYLVAHEYGHQVEWMVNYVRGAKYYRSHDLVTAYAQVRGLPPASVHHGHGGTWHDSVIEVFACDFRILVCRVEKEFWPHPGISRPEEVHGLAEWWQQALDELKTAAAGPGR